MQSQKQKLRVSIVIPVYNEAATLGACLEAIMDQTVKPFEVIVVDNNSSDETVAIAESYNFVKVISEPRQGVIYARNTGFDYAHGTIIGRIDADTIMADNWVETVQDIFANKSIDAVTGSAHYHDIAMARVANYVDLMLRRHLARSMGPWVGLQGANMAMRKSVWRSVRSEVCHTGGIHEDLDLGVHSSGRGFNNVYDESMVASLGFRQAGSPLPEYVRYLMLNPRTYSRHGLNIQVHMYPVILLAIVMFMPIKVLHKGFDEDLQRFSLEKLMQVPQRVRVNPATFVD